MLDLALFLGFALLCLYIAYERLLHRCRTPARRRRTASDSYAHSYVRRACPPSISYALPSPLWSRHEIANSYPVALGRYRHRRAMPLAGDVPTPGEVLTEIGLLLAIHLASLAVTVTLRLFGIA